MSDLRKPAPLDGAARKHAEQMVDFIWASPSPFHAVAETVRRLAAAGFREVCEADPPEAVAPGSCSYIVRGGSIVAWRAGTAGPAEAGFRVVVAHTDSPNLRIKPLPDIVKEGYSQVGVEVYGGALLHTWTDRDLGISGRVIVMGDDGPEARLFRTDRPVARVANLAIHLNRTVNRDGAKLNEQRHLVPILASDEWGGFGDWLSEQLDGREVLSWELGLHDVQKPTLGGMNDEFIFSARLDNLGSCYPAVTAFANAQPAPHTQVLALFDHEEVGSRTHRGAGGPMLGDAIERILGHHTVAAEGGRPRAVANSWLVSADMSHGVHPNYPDKHDANHKPRLGGGPVLKSNAEHRYASQAETMARFRAACHAVGVPCQAFVNRSDLACGSTVGPIVASRIGIPTVDVGLPMLSMHSIREQAGSADAASMVAVLQHILEQG